VAFPFSHVLSLFLSLALAVQTAQMAKRGAFILFEGLDRSGKTTQSSSLVAALKAKGVDVVARRFPDRTTQVGTRL
jgi:dTMP kinase